MRKSFILDRRAALALVTGCLFLFVSVSSSAQQKYKYSFKTPPGITKYIQQHALDVGDVPGHQIRVVELLSKFANEAPEYDGVKVVEARAWIASDYINGNGLASLYAVSTMANGDKIFTRGEILAHTTVGADGSKRTSFSQVSTLSGGTGKFATIRGVLKATGFTDFKTGTSETVTEGEYWFEK